MKSQKREVNAGQVFCDIRQELRLRLRSTDFSSQALSYSAMLFLYSKCYFHSAENLAPCLGCNSLRAGILHLQGNQHIGLQQICLVYKNKLTHNSKEYELLVQDKSLVPQTESQRQKARQLSQKDKVQHELPRDPGQGIIAE